MQPHTTARGRPGALALTAVALGVSLFAETALAGDQTGGLPCAFSAYTGAYRASGFFGGELFYYGIESDGSTAVCLIEGDDGPLLLTLDVSDPSVPVATGFVGVESAERFVYRDGIAYVDSGDFPNTLRIYDLSKPSNPMVLGETALPINIRRMVLGDGLLFIETSDEIKVLDVSDPSAPVEIRTLSPDGGVDSMAARGSLLFIVGGDALLSVYEFATPDEPLLIGTYASDCLFTNTNTREGLAIDGDRLVLQGLLDVELLDISDPTSPLPLGCARRTDITPASTSNEAPDRGLLGNLDLAFVNGRVYARDFELGITSIDWSDPANPVLIGDQDTPGRALDVAFVGGFALVADEAEGIALIDTNAINPIDPRLGRWFGPGLEPSFSAAPVVEDGVAYQVVYNNNLPDGRWEVIAVDVTDPSQPEMLSAYSADWNWPRDIAVRDGVVYVAANQTGLHVIDFRHPRFPSPIIRYAPLSGISTLAHDGDRLAIGEDGPSPVIVLNIANPDAIGIHAIVLPSENANPVAMAMTGSTLYIPGAERDDPTIESISFAEPLRPVSRVQSVPARYDELVIDGGVLYALNRASGGGLYVSPTADLSRTSFMPTGLFEPDSVAAQSGIAYISSYNGLRMIDASDPFQTPTLLASYSNGAEYYQVTVERGRVYAATFSGFDILDASSNCGPCRADLNGDGFLSFFDVAAYIDAYNLGSPVADLDGNGLLNFIDIATYIVEYTAGCP